jgi:putative transposase
MIFKKIIKPGPAAFFITVPTRDHLPIFSLEPLAQQGVLQLSRAAAQANAGIVAYCLLPSSLYMVIAFHEEYDLAGFVYEYKWLSSRAIIALEHGEFHENLFRKGKFRPWMGRFDQIIISTFEQLKSRLDYIHQEPVKKGLVANPNKYEFSSARDWHSDKSGLIEVEKMIPWLE